MNSPHNFSSPCIERLNMQELNELMNTMDAEPWLSHQTLCAIRKFTNVSERAREYTISLLSDSRKFQNEINFAFWIPKLNAQKKLSPPKFEPEIFINGIPKQPTDVITDIIRSDCTSCFDFLRHLVPELTLLSHNMHGWNFLSLIIFHGAHKLFKHLTCNDRSIPLHMLSQAFAGQVNPWPMPLSFMPRDKKLSYEILNDWAERLSSMKLNGEPFIVNGVHPIDKIRFCQFFSVEMAKKMAHIGADMENAMILPSHKQFSPYQVGTTSWHSAAVNGCDFLDRMALHSTLPRSAADCEGIMPLHWALWGQDIDALTWFTYHGGVPPLHIPTRASDTIWQEALQDSCDHNSGVFEALISGPYVRDYPMDWYTAVSLFQVIAVSILDRLLPVVVETMSNEQYEQHRHDCEEEGLRRTQMIWELFRPTPMDSERRQVAKLLHAEVIAIYQHIRFEFLERDMINYRSQSFDGVQSTPETHTNGPARRMSA